MRGDVHDMVVIGGVAGGSLQNEAGNIGRADFEHFPFGGDQHVLMAVPLEFSVEQIALM